MIIAGNWKMNPSFEQLTPLLAGYAQLARICESGVSIVCFPPACYLQAVQKHLQSTSVEWGAQDCHFAVSGAFTGDISCQMIQGFGSKWVILGHSERRSYHNESDSQVSAKLEQAVLCGLKTILCVGEPETEREQGCHDSFVQNQLEHSLATILDMEEKTKRQVLEKLVIAYEPVWAIGTGKVASIEQITQMHKGLTERLDALFSSDMPEGGIPVLYGGSVKSDNAEAILQADYVSGALVGGASLTVNEFSSICSAAMKA